MDISYKGIGLRIKKRRKELKLSQLKVAELAEIDANTFSHIERGTTKLSLPTLIQVANALGLSLDEILYDSMEHNSHVSVKMIDDILSDCSAKELKAFVEVLHTTKRVLRDL